MHEVKQYLSFGRWLEDQKDFPFELEERGYLEKGATYRVNKTIKIPKIVYNFWCKETTYTEETVLLAHVRGVVEVEIYDQSIKELMENYIKLYEEYNPLADIKLIFTIMPK